MRVTGENFTDGCDDQGTGAVIPPLQDQPVTFTQAGQARTLDEVDSPDGTIDVIVALPADAQPGPADVQVGYSTVVTITIT